MSHRKWRETKQQLICWPDLALLGCCSVSLHFQCDILAPITVENSVEMNLCSLLLLVAVAASPALSAKSYDGYKVPRVSVQSISVQSEN